MSSSPTLVTQQHFDYIANHTAKEDAFLEGLKAAALEADIPAIWISPAQASFLQILLKLCRAQQVVEVGTLAGYSAIAMARALPEGGLVRTIELDAKHVRFAREWIAKSDVANKVEVLEGSGDDVLAGMEPHSADAAFLDADKAGYKNYLVHCMRIVRPGGLIMVDNAFAFGQLFDSAPTDAEVPAVREFNDFMSQQEGLHSVIVPTGDGCWVAIKT